MLLAEPRIGSYRSVHLVELGVWVACGMLAIAVAVGTLGTDFPSRSLSLSGEAFCLAAAALLAGLAARRLRRSEQRLPSRFEIGAITLRLSFGVPAFLFVLVASAAGFAA